MLAIYQLISIFFSETLHKNKRLELVVLELFFFLIWKQGESISGYMRRPTTEEKHKPQSNPYKSFVHHRHGITSCMAVHSLGSCSFSFP